MSLKRKDYSHTLNRQAEAAEQVCREISEKKEDRHGKI